MPISKEIADAIHASKLENKFKKFLLNNEKMAEAWFVDNIKTTTPEVTAVARIPGRDYRTAMEMPSPEMLQESRPRTGEFGLPEPVVQPSVTESTALTRIPGRAYEGVIEASSPEDLKASRPRSGDFGIPTSEPTTPVAASVEEFNMPINEATALARIPGRNYDTTPGTPASTALILGTEAPAEAVGVSPAAQMSLKKKAAIGAGAAGGLVGVGYAAKKFMEGKEAPGYKAPEVPSILTPKGAAAYGAEKAKQEKPAEFINTLGEFEAYSKKSQEAPDMKEEEQDLANLAAQLKNDMNMAALEYKKSKDDIAKSQLWEGIVNAVGAIASGMYGIRTGTDMGGVKFNKTDWMQQIKSAQDELQLGMLRAEKDYNVAKEAVDARKKGKLDHWQINQKLYENAKAEVDQRNAQKMKKAEFGLDIQKASSSLENMKNELDLKRKELMLKAMETTGETNKQRIRQQLEKAKEFNNALEDYSKDDSQFNLERLRRINTEASSLGASLVNPDALSEGGLFGAFNPDASKIEQARMAPPSKVKMMGPSGVSINVNADAVEALKAKGWQIIQQQ